MIVAARQENVVLAEAGGAHDVDVVPARHLGLFAFRAEQRENAPDRLVDLEAGCLSDGSHEPSSWPVRFHS